ncbi:MAG: CTP synthase, partial [Magnetococcus sp. YQC-5]
PYIPTSGELKTKPTQHSVKELRAIGIQPDILVCRTDREIVGSVRKKIALFCNVEPDAVICCQDQETIYRVPFALHLEGFARKALQFLNLRGEEPRMDEWEAVLDKIVSPAYKTTIGIVGKYVELKDAYKSLSEALSHGGIANDCRVSLRWVNADDLTREDPDALLSGLDGILVPGGFGERGAEGKIRAVYHARTNKIPYLGICLGMQMAVVEFARNVAELPYANSSEFSDQTPDPVIALLTEWKSENEIHRRDMEMDKGGTMRLGAYPCILTPGSHAALAYGALTISERHRHRYEFNNNYRNKLVQAGLIISGTSPDGELVEVVEVPDHPFFVACQYHPEFKSRPRVPHPLFAAFIKAALTNRRG